MFAYFPLCLQALRGVGPFFLSRKSLSLLPGQAQWDVTGADSWGWRRDVESRKVGRKRLPAAPNLSGFSTSLGEPSQGHVPFL